MKIFGTLREIVATVFRKDGVEVTLKPNSNTYMGATEFQLPPKTSGNGVLVASGDIVNADIADGAAIVDTKLATISTAGKVSNSATTASSSAGNNTIVLRDSSGNFSAGTITASLSGNADTATTATSFSGSLAGDVSGTQGTTSVDKIKGKAVSTTAPTDAQTLVWNNSTSQYVPVSIGGDVTMSNAGNVQIAAGAITNADINNSAAIAGSKISPDFGMQTVQTSGSVNTNLLTTTGLGTMQKAFINGTGSNGFIEMEGQSLAGFPAPSQATRARIFAGSDGKLYGYNGGGAAPFAIGAGAGGSGEVNAVLNPSANDDTSGWTAGTSHTVTRDSANSPLSPVVSTSLALTSSAAVSLGSQTPTSGVYDAITMPTALQNRKLKVEFFYTTPASSGGTWAVSVYQGSTKVPLSTDSGGDTILPSGVTGGKFTAYFDTTSSSSYSVNLVQRTRTTTNTLYVTNVVVGPGIQPQGAVVGEWVSYTPSLAGISAQAGTATGRYRRVGNSMEVDVRFISSGAATGVISVGLPSGLSIDSTQVTTSGVDGQIFGVVHATDTGTGYHVGAVTYASSTAFRFTGDGGATNYTTNTPFVWANNDALSFFATVPIAEWAGSGTLTVAQNDVEYASNSDTSAADITSAFAYGPNGSLIPSITAATGTPFSYFKRVSFQTPIQVGDRIGIEIQLNGTGPWIPLENISDQYQAMRVDSSSGNRWGIGYMQNTSNTVDVYFGRAGRLNSGWAGGAGPNFPTNAADRWRVRKSSAGAAVGFGIVSPGVSSGLVSASGLPGNTTGNAIASGYVGEVLGTAQAGTNGSAYCTVSSVALTTSLVSVASLNLNKGTYFLNFSGYANKAPNINGERISGFVYIGNTQISNTQFSSVPTNVSGGLMGVSISYPILITADSTTVAVYLQTVDSNSFGNGTWRISAVRIA